MNNFIQDGKTARVTAPTGGILASAVVVLGTANQIGIAIDDIEAGEVGTLQTEGVYELPANDNLVINQFDPVYWDAGDGEINKTATGNTRAGIAWVAKTQTGTTVKVKINA